MVILRGTEGWKKCTIEEKGRGVKGKGCDGKCLPKGFTKG